MCGIRLVETVLRPNYTENGDFPKKIGRVISKEQRDLKTRPSPACQWTCYQHSSFPNYQRNLLPLRLKIINKQKSENDFFTVLDNCRRLKSSQATSRGGLAAYPTEWTLSYYSSDSVVSSACTISTDGGADHAHLKPSSALVDRVDLRMGLCFWYVYPCANEGENRLIGLLLFHRNGHYYHIRVQHPRSHLCSQVSTCTPSSYNPFCC